MQVCYNTKSMAICANFYLLLMIREDDDTGNLKLLTISLLESRYIQYLIYLHNY